MLGLYRLLHLYNDIDLLPVRFLFGARGCRLFEGMTDPLGRDSPLYGYCSRGGVGTLFFLSLQLPAPLRNLSRGSKRWIPFLVSDVVP